jgi:hypothetical protein
MEAKAIQATRSKLNELAVNHNKLTTLVAILLTEIQSLKEDMDQIKQVLEGVEVVSNGDEEKSAPTPAPAQAQRIQPQQQQRMMNMAPTQPIQQSQTIKSSSRSRRSGNSSLAELHADDIIKQLTLNSD